MHSELKMFCATDTLTPADPINPCFQRLTYEEKMARRLLGADNAATVLNTQDTEEEPVTQVWRLFIRIHAHSRNHTGMETFTNMSTPVVTYLFISLFLLHDASPIHLNHGFSWMSCGVQPHPGSL